MERPNVVVIVADTFRRDHLGAYGNPYIRTPYLDELARSSVVFDRHVVSSFPTMPARADILTGTFSYAHMGWEPLPRHLMTLPELLSSAGYLTMGVVDTPFFIRNGFGYDRGFNDFVWSGDRATTPGRASGPTRGGCGARRRTGWWRAR
jgi:arylsulfatase A-like enzyme